VIGAPIVVARKAKERWERQDDEGGRERKPARPEIRLGAEPRVRRTPKNFRGIKRREIVEEPIIHVLERYPRSIHDEGGKDDESKCRCRPPRIPARGSTQASGLQGFGLGHRLDFTLRVLQS